MLITQDWDNGILLLVITQEWDIGSWLKFIFWIYVRRWIYWYTFWHDLHKFQIWHLYKLLTLNFSNCSGCHRGILQNLEEHPLNYHYQQKMSSYPISRFHEVLQQKITREKMNYVPLKGHCKVTPNGYIIIAYMYIKLIPLQNVQSS